jgi:ATP-binding cassette subfamily B protein
MGLDALDGRGLPGSVRAEDAEDLPLLHGEGDGVHRDGGPVGLVEMFNLNDCYRVPP